MVIRVYHVRVLKGKQPEYERLIREGVIPLMQNEPGVTAVYVGHSMDAPQDYMIVTVWKDLNTLMAFMDGNWQKSSDMPGEAQLVEQVWVDHFETLPVDKG